LASFCALKYNVEQQQQRSHELTLKNVSKIKSVGMKVYKLLNFFTFLTLFIALFPKEELKAQDPVFSQFFHAPLQLNPALTGTSAAPVFHLNYRNQWPSINQAYVTYAASYNQFAPKYNSGFGLSVLADVAGNGIYTGTQIGMSYAYSLQFDRDFYIRLGLEGNFVSKRLAWDKLIFFDQIDVETGAYDANGNLNPTAENQPGLSQNYFDFGFGALLHTPYFYGGVSLKHINSPQEGFYQINENYGELPARFSLHAGGKIPLTQYNKLRKSSFISPNVLFVKQRQFHQLNVGAYAQYDIFLGGIWFRHTFSNADAVIFMLGFEKNAFKIAYSYDLTVSQLGAASGGAHEVSLILNFGGNLPQKDYNDCLQMFR
jgi:type IX secretion system PorP/SprF family membrane protein